ncbi:hypothetical protein Tco_1472324, partial [Tanacetum coccineum]
FQQELDETLYQAWERFKELLMKCPQYYLTEMQEVILFYKGLNIQTRQILDSRGAIPTKTAADAKKAIQEMVEYSQKWHNGTSKGRRGGYRATAPGYYQRNNANPLFQEQRQSMKETLSKFMSESAKRHKENSILIKEIRALMDVAIRNQGASIKTLEIQIGNMSKSISTTNEADSNPIFRIRSTQYAISPELNRTLLYKPRQMTVPFPGRLEDHYCKEEGNYGPKFTEAYGASLINNTIPQKEKDPRIFTLPCFINDFCFDNALVDLGASISVMPLSTYLNIGLGELAHIRLTVQLADRTVKYLKGIAENVLVGIGKFIFLIDFIILDMPEDIKVPLILGTPLLSTACAKIDIYKRKITLRVREEKIVFKSVKPASSLIKRVYMISLRERMELDLESSLWKRLWC